MTEWWICLKGQNGLFFPLFFCVSMFYGSNREITQELYLWQNDVICFEFSVEQMTNLGIGNCQHCWLPTSPVDCTTVPTWVAINNQYVFINGRGLHSLNTQVTADHLKTRLMVNTMFLEILLGTITTKNTQVLELWLKTVLGSRILILLHASDQRHLAVNVPQCGDFISVPADHVGILG